MSRASSSTRLGLIGLAFGCGLVVVLAHLWLLMVADQEVWARRSHENRWAFRSVPSQRGALLDRFGRVLAVDRPTSKVSIYYLRFRIYNAIGAAVHGATRWTHLRRDLPGVSYSYYPGALGPTAAVEELLAMPVAVLKRNVLPKKEAAALLTSVKTVLAQCSGWSRSKVHTALREAAERGEMTSVGDVLAVGRASLLHAFDQRLRAMQDLDRRIGAAQDRLAREQGRDRDALLGLIDTLEKMRHLSIEKARTVRENERGETVPGALREQILEEFASDIEFELAAALRVDRRIFVGIEVHPAVTRVQNVERGTSLQVMLGKVYDFDRTIEAITVDAPPQPATAANRAPADATANKRKVVKVWDPNWFDDVEQNLEDTWLDELVPEGVVDGERARQRLQESARQRYARAVLMRERRGVTGMEEWLDTSLSGRLGMRFVEHDSKRREQLLWSHLRVKRGDDVRLTIDQDLQDLAEREVRATRERLLGAYQRQGDRDLLQTAVALIDAGTGDILAYAGAPITSENVPDIPGVRWQGNGSVGSVIKPIVMVEHLDSALMGRPHLPLDQMKPCGGRIVIESLRPGAFGCDGVHGQNGLDPVQVLARSCNVFFYQASMAMGHDGIDRALRRFGLKGKPDGGGPYDACWQPRIRGFAAHPPSAKRTGWLVQRAIGYGVQVSPIHIARAYAGIATGALPTLSMVLGHERSRVSLMGFEDSLAVVRRGLQACVQTGTASRLGPRLKLWDVHAKTGTAEVGEVNHQNNAWFAGYLPWRSQGGVQLAFAAVAYWVPDGDHGADVAGAMVERLLGQMSQHPHLQQYYLTKEDN